MRARTPSAINVAAASRRCSIGQAAARRFHFLFLPLLLLSACSHYHLGTGAELKFKTLYIEPVENNTSLPQVVAIASTQLREAFLRDGRVTLVNNSADAEATLVIHLTQYAREVATVLPNDTGLARKFDLSLKATATLRDNRTGKPLFADRPLTVKRQIFTDNPRTTGDFGNQLQAEYQAVPLLAETLASAAAHAVLDVW